MDDVNEYNFLTSNKEKNDAQIYENYCVHTNIYENVPQDKSTNQSVNSPINICNEVIEDNEKLKQKTDDENITEIPNKKINKRTENDSNENVTDKKLNNQNDGHELPAKKPETEMDHKGMVQRELEDDHLYEPMTNNSDEQLYTTLSLNDSTKTKSDNTHHTAQNIPGSNVYVNFGFLEKVEKIGDESEQNKDANKDGTEKTEINESDNDNEQLQMEDGKVKSLADKFPRITYILEKLKQPGKVEKIANIVDKKIHKILLGLVTTMTCIIILAMIIIWTAK